MNILIFSQAAWDDKNSVGNTMSNLFGGWKDNFYHFYTRKQRPQNNMECRYLNISAIDALKGIFKRHICDADVITNSEIDSNTDIDTEKKRIEKIHSKGGNLAYYISDMVWISKIWMKKDFKEYIESANPDVLFSFAVNPENLLPLIKYLKKHTDCKIVLFAVDDVQGQIEKYPALRRTYHRRMFRKCIESADYLYGISGSLTDKYESIFARKVEVLHKGCEFEYPVSNTVNKPLRIIYAGNLLFGRDTVLEEIRKELDLINEDEIKAVLEIYTTAILDESIKSRLESKSSKLMGSRTYEEIKKINNEADYVLLVESFEDEQIESVRYSFSTKIIDCLQSGSGVIAIGPAGIESIEYMRSIDGAVVIDRLDQIKEVLTDLIDNPEQATSRAESVRECGMRKHNIIDVREQLRNDFERIISM